MKVIKFEEDQTYLPVTPIQFQEIANEMLTGMNILCDNQFVDADIMAVVVIQVIHGLDKKTGIISKFELFERCVNRLCNATTEPLYHEIQFRISAKEKEQREQKPLAAVPDLQIEH